MFGKKRQFAFVFAFFAFVLINAAPLSAQEVGGSLGGSAGVFRPKNPASAAPKSEASGAISKKKSSVPKSKPAVKKDKPAKKIVNITPAATVQRPKAAAPTAKKTAANIEDLFDGAIERGNVARDERRYDAAEKAYRDAMRIKPRDNRAAYGLGNIFIDQQLWDSAEKFYRQSLALDASNVEANIALSYVLMQPNRGNTITLRVADAEKAVRRAVALDNDNAIAFDQLGVVLEARGVIGAEAENAYRRAVELDPKYAVAYAHLGRLMRKNGRKNDALNAYKKAVDLADDVPSMILVAEVLQTEQRFDESEKVLRRAVALDATNPIALYLLGRALIVRRNNVEAESVLLRSTGISPRTFAPLWDLGLLYLRAGRFAEAEKIYLKALPLASGVERKQIAGVSGLTGIGDGYFRRNQKTDALRVYRKARELDGDNKQLVAKISAASK